MLDRLFSFIKNRDWHIGWTWKFREFKNLVGRKDSDGETATMDVSSNREGTSSEIKSSGG